MRSIIVTSIAASTLLAGLATAQPPRYTVTDLGTLGGTFSIPFGINSAGRVAGGATLPGGSLHPFLWDDGHMTDLGTLGGPNGNAGGPNGRDELAVLAETSKPDPLGEDFCGFSTHLICLGALWQKGALTPLPTLGGNNGQAFSLNNRGQVIGIAETSTRDPTCTSPQVLDFEAVIWGPKPGEIQELRPLPGDSVGFALGINDKGQVVGSSGSCANTPLFPLAIGPHAVLWKNGSATDLGNLGGTKVNVAAAINNRGEVVGAADLPSETPGFPMVQVHSFLWTKDTGMQDLGTVGADFSSFPAGSDGINNKGQVVGSSCDSNGNCRAYLWEDKVMMDLNALTPANSPLYLQMANGGINDAGEIAGVALVKSTGEVHAFLATPRCRNRADTEQCEDDTEGTVDE
jgi:probable HAF family extracellular repeat protein